MREMHIKHAVTVAAGYGKEPADCQIAAAATVLDNHHHGAACLETA